MKIVHPGESIPCATQNYYELSTKKGLTTEYRARIQARLFTERLVWLGRGIKNEE